MTTNWIDGELLAFDLETTGVDKFEDVPVSFALVWFEDHEVVRTRAELVNPEREIPEGASAIHGISTERAMAEGLAMSDAVSEVADALLDYYDLGVSTFLIRGFDPFEDTIDFGRELIPRLRAGAVDLDRARAA